MYYYPYLNIIKTKFHNIHYIKRAYRKQNWNEQRKKSTIITCSFQIHPKLTLFLYKVLVWSLFIGKMSREVETHEGLLTLNTALSGILLCLSSLTHATSHNTRFLYSLHHSSGLEFGAIAWLNQLEVYCTPLWWKKKLKKSDTSIW